MRGMDGVGFNKNVLIISNNVLSDQNNNGKTLLSFFSVLPRECLTQIFFSDEPINKDLAGRFFRLSDSSIFKMCLSLNPPRSTFSEDLNFNFCCNANCGFGSNFLRKLKGYDFFRLLREAMWFRANVDYGLIEERLRTNPPDVIFFCAGDTLFSYRIYEKICSIYPSAKKVLYITDDYIMPRVKVSPLWWLRRNFILKKMMCSVVKSDIFVTISEQMRNEYRKIFKKDSICVFNIANDIKIESFSKSKRDDLILIYAGGLHLERWLMLEKIGIAIDRYNKINSRKISLKVYSHQIVDKKVINRIDRIDSASFCGSLSIEELQIVLNDADILVHVESFANRYVESTRLSISTKISEYLSADKMILAVGPPNVASMKFLNDFAYCVTETEELDRALGGLFESRHNVSHAQILSRIDRSNKHFLKKVLFD